MQKRLANGFCFNFTALLDPSLKISLEGAEINGGKSEGLRPPKHE